MKLLNTPQAIWKGGNIPLGLSRAPLAPFYGVGPGKIAIHYATDAVTLSGGNVVALQNKGGAGAVFDAKVSGAGIPVSDNFLTMAAGGSYPTVDNSVDLVGVHMMWVALPSTSAARHRVFGKPASATVQMDYYTTTERTYIYQLEPAVSMATTAHNLPVGLRLYGIEMDGASVKVFINGELVSTDPLVAAQFLVTSLGKGSSETDQYAGLMGDVLGVTLGAGSAEAITAAREYLAVKFGVALI